MFAVLVGNNKIIIWLYSGKSRERSSEMDNERLSERKTILTKELLEREYNKELLSQREIADKYGRSRKFIARLVEKYGIVPLYNRDYLRKVKMVPTQEQTQVLLGSLMGDGYLKRFNEQCIFEVMHSLKHLTYLVWKADILRNYENSKPFHVNAQTLKGSGKHLYKIKFATAPFPYLSEIYNLLYIEGRKNVSLEMLNNLNALGLAVWFSDSGIYFSNQEMYFFGDWSATKGDLITKWFWNKWNLKAFYRETKKNKVDNKRILLREEDAKKLATIIFPFIIPSMRYKFKFVKIESSESISQTPECNIQDEDVLQTL